jgi:hypothetical protein
MKRIAVSLVVGVLGRRTTNQRIDMRCGIFWRSESGYLSTTVRLAPGCAWARTGSR